MPKQRISPVLLMITAFTLVIIVALITRMVLTQPTQTTSNDVVILQDAESFDGVTRLDPTPITDVTLTDTNGQTMAFSAYQGRYVLTFFGFTHCPDVCPITMSDFRQVKQLLGEHSENVTFLMISVDGERDTPAVLDRFVKRFDPSFIGLTGTEAVIRPFALQFGAEFTLNKSPGAANYTVDHTASSFLVDPQGNLVAKYLYGIDPQVIVDDLVARLG
ncbi:MAG: SCO family protein [Anaerolineae bacterium]|jgi:protein SCO1/2|nr:SCO family protein [Anaerolineae bacterium]